MKLRRAMLAGAAGAIARSAAMFLLRVAGFDVNLEAMLGSLTDLRTPQAQWTIGFAMHLGIGAAAGVLYGAAFEMAMQQSGALIGAGLGLSHMLLAGLFMSGIPAMNPVGSGGVAAPGAFLSNVPYGPLFFLLLHLLYGGVVGALYGPPVQETHLYARDALPRSSLRLR